MDLQQRKSARECHCSEELREHGMYDFEGRFYTEEIPTIDFNRKEDFCCHV